MRKRRVYLLVVGVGALTFCLGANGFHPSEPEFGGKKLREWVDGENQHGGSDFVDAIQHIGTNAVPFLLKWIKYEPPSWKTKSLFVVNKMFHSTLIDRRHLRANGAKWTLLTLGVKAEAAIPALSRLMNDTKIPATARRATDVLALLAPQLLSAELALMTNNSAALRLSMVNRIGINDSSHSDVPPRGPVLEALLRSFEDPNTQVATAAIDKLGLAAIEPNLVVPALVRSLQDSTTSVRAYACASLGRFGTEARSAAPALLKMLNDPDEAVRLVATNALLVSTPSALERAGR